MDYERFKEGFQDALKAELAVRGADVELTARRVDKMNDSYDAITVRPVDSSIGVNISVEKAFAAYENGTPIPEIAEHFADAVEKGFRESPQVDLESLSDYEQMKSKLSMEVVSAEKNAELLESVPHERMEDMAVVYRFVLDQTDSGNGTILVTNQLLDQYGITKEQLRADAMENAPEIRPSEIKERSVQMAKVKKIRKWDEVTGNAVEEQIPESIDPIEDVGAGPSISRNHMRGIEDMVEQNDNSFDGIINNVPAAPVPDFAEINEKADQEDIIADTKASVMEKIKEQQEKVKLATIPEPEKKTPVICPCREM